MPQLQRLLLAGTLLALALSLACSGGDGLAGGDATTASASLKEASQTAERFAQALAGGDFDQVWQMLTPGAQQRWLDARAFTAFLFRKFGALDTELESGGAKLNEDGSSATVAVSLIVEDPPATYNGPPLVLELHSGRWRVANAGPAGPRGPVIAGRRAPPVLRDELTVPILIYHHFAPVLPEDFQERTNTVTADAFEEQLAWLSANGYQTISLAEMYNAFYYDLPLPPKPIIPVFDDGYEDAYLQAFPLLVRYGLGATVAMISGFADQPGYLSWDQIREMDAAGIEFISHTASHVDLAAASAETARSELAVSRQTLEEQLGRPAQFLVYPYGQPFSGGSEEAQAMILALLPETGYAGALTTSSGPPYITLQRANAPYQLQRIPVSGGESLARFVASIGATP